LDTKQAAAQHHKAQRTVQEAAHGGRIPARKVEQRWDIGQFKQWPTRRKPSPYAKGKPAIGKPAFMYAPQKPKLVGTPKQIAYAEKIRDEYIFVQKHDKKPITDVYEHKSTVWWIEHRKQYITHADVIRRPKYYKQK
jgi:hypothetical protein